ncbi:MAG: PAS domain-containing protein, partial [Hyphomicrobiales bacterium]|nr:PAS domain-containing protein [Hyphomicrobiales bacterium]
PSVVAAPFDQALLDRLPVGIAIYRDSQTLFANRPLLDWLGYPSVEAFAANGGTDAIFPDGEDPSRTPDGTGALKAVRSDGTTIDVEARLHAVTWGGATALMLSLAEAVAQRPAELEADAEAADADGERARELEAILDTATDGVIVIDGAGVVDGMNRTAEALFGVSTNAV